MEARIVSFEGVERWVPDENHPTERFVYCLQGAVTAEVDKEIYRLEEGDGLYLLSEARVSFGNQNPRGSSLLIVEMKAAGSCS